MRQDIPDPSLDPSSPSQDSPGINRRQLLKYITAASSLLVAGAAPQAAHADVTLPNGMVIPAGLRAILNGQTAIVTGAARGIGQAIAVTLALAGANIVGIDICANISTASYPLATPEDLTTTGKYVTYVGSKFVPVIADVRSLSALESAVSNAISTFGKIDILCANAGINVYNTPIQSITDAQWQDILDVNLTGYANSIRAVAGNMIQNKSGVIVCTASVDGRSGQKANASYTTSKWGVVGLVKCAALDLGPYNIRVAAVAPGTVATGMTLNQASYAWTNPFDPTQRGWEEANLIMNALPSPYLEPADIAEGVLYLASPLARYVTGTILDIAQGRNARYTA